MPCSEQPLFFDAFGHIISDRLYDNSTNTVCLISIDEDQTILNKLLLILTEHLRHIVFTNHQKLAGFACYMSNDLWATIDDISLG